MRVKRGLARQGQPQAGVQRYRSHLTDHNLAPDGIDPRPVMRCVDKAGQGERHPALTQAGRFQNRHRQAHGRLPYDPLQLHEHPRAQAEPLACISSRIWSVTYKGVSIG